MKQSLNGYHIVSNLPANVFYQALYSAIGYVLPAAGEFLYRCMIIFDRYGLISFLWLTLYLYLWPNTLWLSIILLRYFVKVPIDSGLKRSVCHLLSDITIYSTYYFDTHSHTLIMSAKQFYLIIIVMNHINYLLSIFN